MDFRVEKDTMGEIMVPADSLWGAQTQRSLQNFRIGDVKMPKEIISAFASLKKACALVNGKTGRISEEKTNLIDAVCDEILSGELSDNFPLSVEKRNFPSLISRSVTFSGSISVKNTHSVLYSFPHFQESLIWNFFVFLSNTNSRFTLWRSSSSE